MRTTAAWVDSWVAAGSVALLGGGVFLVFASIFTSDLAVAALGAGAASVSLALLFTSGWVGALPVLAGSLALPPAYASEAIRLGPALLVTLMVVGSWVLARGVEDRRLELGRLPRLPIAFFLTWVVVSAGFAPDRGSAVRETANLLLFFAFLAVATDLLIRKPGSVGVVAAILGWMAGLAGFVAVLQTLAIVPSSFALGGTSFYRATGGFAWPNEMAMYLGVSIPFAVLLHRSASTGTGKALAAAAVVCAVAGLGATFSRASWIAVTLAPVGLVLVGRGRLALAAWLLGALAAGIFDLASGGALSGRVAATLTDPLVGQRFLLTRAGVMMFLAHPLVGMGPGGFEAGLDEFGLLVPGLFDFVGSAHNAYVHVASELGLPGLLGFVGFMAGTWLILLRSARRMEEPAERALAETLFWSFTTAGLISFAEWSLTHGVAQLIMFIAAMGFAVDARRQT